MRGRRYRAWSRFIHRFNYHHTTTIYPDGNIQDWCQWCGLRTTRVDLERTFAELSSLAKDSDTPEKP